MSTLDWLVPEAQRLTSPHRYPSTRRVVKPLDVVVLHYTASPWQAPAADEARVRRWLQGDGRESSTHFVILRSGLLLQGMPLADRAWHVVDKFPHAGRPLNVRSVAVDFANVGFLKQVGERYLDVYGGVYQGPQPVQVEGRWWEPVTEAQVTAAVDLMAQLGAAFPALREPGRLICHSDVQPTRVDPGPTVPLERLAAALRGVQLGA